MIGPDTRCRQLSGQLRACCCEALLAWPCCCEALLAWPTKMAFNFAADMITMLLQQAIVYLIAIPKAITFCDNGNIGTERNCTVYSHC